jgi:hypothetical protein
MTVKVTKPEINVRSELADLRKPTGIAGEAMLRAETPQEQFNLIGAGRRNLLINGAMQVAQRGTSFTTTSAYTLDRWKFQTDLLDQYAHTVTRSSDAPDGFFNSFKIEVTTTETTVESTEDLAVTQFIEAQDCQALAAGTTSAKPLSLSFWVKSSVTGNFAVSLTASDDDKIFPTTYVVNSANTWEYKTIYIPPCTIATIDNDNGQGLSLRFITLSGSSYTSGSTGAWQSYASGLFAAGHQAQISTDGDTWQITGVQLELGKVATPFEHPRSYGEELAACERYYQSTYKLGTNTGETEASWGDGNVTGPKFSTEMRAAPAVALYTYDDAGVGIVDSGGTNRAAVAQQISAKGVRYLSLTSGTANTWVAYRYTANAEL